MQKGGAERGTASMLLTPPTANVVGGAAARPSTTPPSQELDAKAPRRFAVLNPLKVTLEGLSQGSKTFNFPNHPKDPSMGSRELKLTSPIYIERDDFR